MKGLTWVVVFVAIGIAAGAIAAALMPARYRAVTAVHIEAARDPDVTFLYRLNARLDYLLQRSLSEDRMERLMQEVGLYKAERDSGRSADALLLLRASTAVLRHREDETTERWMVAFEANDAGTAELTSLRLASLIKEQADTRGWRLGGLSTEEDPKVERLLEDIRAELILSETEIREWPRKHDGRPAPPALRKQFDALGRDYSASLKRYEPIEANIDFAGPVQLKAEIVKVPRGFDGRVDPPFRSFAGMGAAAGLFIGLFTMPPFFWWRRHIP
jgi:hypothetical protein